MAFAKGDIQILQRPVRVSRRDVAQLEMVDGEAPGEVLGRSLKRIDRLRVAANGAAIDGEGKADQRVAEQQAFHPASGSTATMRPSTSA
jgi:hypothetical protein